MRKPFFIFLLFIFLQFVTTETSVAQGKILNMDAAKRVAFKTAHGNYLSAVPGGRLINTVSKIGPWEVFTIIPRNNNKFNIVTCHGSILMTTTRLFYFIPLPVSHSNYRDPNFQCVEFYIYDFGDGISFRTEGGFADDGWVQAQPGPFYNVYATGPKVGPWEKFQLIRDPVVAKNAAGDEEESETETETIKYDANKDQAVVAFFEKVAKAGQKTDSVALVDILPAKALKTAADEIRGHMKNGSTKAALEKIGITAEDMNLEDKALMAKYLTSAMKMAKQEAEKSGGNGEMKIEVLATKIDGDTAFAKIKYTSPSGSTVEVEQKLVKEGGVWVMAEEGSNEDDAGEDD